jgi:hypothetical protein
MNETVGREGLDAVIFRARRDGASEASQMTRNAAETRRQELEADGWIVDIEEITVDED